MNHDRRRRLEQPNVRNDRGKSHRPEGRLKIPAAGPNIQPRLLVRDRKIRARAAVRRALPLLGHRSGQPRLLRLATALAAEGGSLWSGAVIRPVRDRARPVAEAQHRARWRDANHDLDEQEQSGNEIAEARRHRCSVYRLNRAKVHDANDSGDYRASQLQPPSRQGEGAAKTTTETESVIFFALLGAPNGEQPVRSIMAARLCLSCPILPGARAFRADEPALRVRVTHGRQSPDSRQQRLEAQRTDLTGPNGKETPRTTATSAIIDTAEAAQAAPGDHNLSLGSLSA
jgi:hypothetical protein